MLPCQWLASDALAVSRRLSWALDRPPLCSMWVLPLHPATTVTAEGWFLHEFVSMHVRVLFENLWKAYVVANFVVGELLKGKVFAGQNKL